MVSTKTLIPVEWKSMVLSIFPNSAMLTKVMKVCGFIGEDCSSFMTGNTDYPQLMGIGRDSIQCPFVGY